MTLLLIALIVGVPVGLYLGVLVYFTAREVFAMLHEHHMEPR